MKIKLTIEYDGKNFFGWQKQNEFNSVQETIEKAIEKVFNQSESIELYGAGRTDTGVHASGQVAHFSISNENLIKKWENNIQKLPIAINFYLLDFGTVVTNAEIVPEDFHARFSAKMRHYKYIIYNRKVKSVIHENRVWHIVNPLDENAMNMASKFFIGTHNLNAFRSAHCNSNNPIRTISDIKVYRDNYFVIMEIAARSFLHNQVRITIGTLKQIGTGKFPIEYIKDLLEKQDRTKSGITAPPCGLYLTKIDY